MASRAEEAFARAQREAKGHTNGHKRPSDLSKALKTHGITKAIADEICHTDHFARDASHKLYRYQDGVYRRHAEQYIERRVKGLLLDAGLAQKWTTRRSQEIVSYIAIDAPDLDETPALHMLNLQNGLFDTQAQILRPHSPTFLSAIQLPITYNPTAPATVWETFERQVLPADCQGLMFQVAAWLMLPHKHIQKAILLLGEGGNGKSTLLGALRAFIGRQHTTSIPLHKLEADKFAVIRLLGKLVNICPDLPSRYLETTAVFKALTGFNDVLVGERKYVQDTIEFEPFCRLLFSANRPPRSGDDSQGFFDRWLVIPCEAQFRGTATEKRPEEMSALLSAPDALSGALNRAIAMLPLVQREGFKPTPSMATAFQEFRETTDPLAVWLDRHIIISMGSYIVKDVLVDAYNRECERRNRSGVTKTAFTKALTRLKPLIAENQRTVNGTMTRVYNDIAWRSSTHQEQM
jgi:putative DNA primase/helicase